MKRWSAMRQRKIRAGRRDASGEGGFTLAETCIALVLMMIVGMGVASLFVYGLNNVSGTNDRELAMAVAQQQMETYRSMLYNALAAGSTTTTVSNGGRQYSVQTTIADSNVVGGTAKLKTITIQVTPKAGGSTWMKSTAVYSAVTLITQRSSKIVGTY